MKIIKALFMSAAITTAVSVLLWAIVCFVTLEWNPFYAGDSMGASYGRFVISVSFLYFTYYYIEE